MTVYILSTGSHSDWTILGVYSTRERAEADKARFERVRHFDYGDGVTDETRFAANPIREIELDERQEHHRGGYFGVDDADEW